MAGWQRPYASGGTGPLLLDHIDPDAAALIADFKGALRRTAGSLAAGWRRCIDPKGGGRVSWRGWCEALHSRGRSQLPARFNDVEVESRSVDGADASWS
ncbi:hypothetical protein FOZ63_020248 [Perkinsus olseni]|uniref:Uncharacterized protein n=1 Tax=Perkinsus olseni TaxID=32597 RepID=A0A7J6SU02_PEROL|nr:hypothetical protein FOZ63_020248 [Perkinsus olseni]